MKSSLYLIALCTFLCSGVLEGVKAQNTVGLLSHNEKKASPGYNLFYPHNQSTVFLVDNCGRLVHEWTDDVDQRPGNSVYLLENGNLVKCTRPNSFLEDPIWAGGGGAAVEILSWDNNLRYSFTLNDSLFRLHHDVAPMPNGNILMIAWARKSGTEAVQAGRDPDLLPQDEIWSEAILEWDPEADSIVWEWHVWDHLVQDHDAGMENYGVVADHPELIDVNYDEHDGHPDWLHANAIDYNPVLDQVVISIPHFNEIWIIDHSTTTAEAASHEGGSSGKGGDLLYRWGNPVAYQRGKPEDKKLFFQHDVHWPYPGALPGEEGFGQLVLFNNRVGQDTSSVNAFMPPFDTLTRTYTLEEDSFFGPDAFLETKVHPNGIIKAASAGLSSVQILPNDNWLICSGRWGYSYELTPSNEIVWEFITPIKMGQPATQGDTLAITDNITFRLNRYALDFPGFAGKDLTPKGYIEQSPNVGFCGLTTSVRTVTQEEILQVFPNPVSEVLTIETSYGKPQPALLMDATGRPVRQFRLSGTRTSLDVGDLPAGFYILKTEHAAVKVLVQRF